MEREERGGINHFWRDSALERYMLAENHSTQSSTPALPRSHRAADRRPHHDETDCQNAPKVLHGLIGS